MHILRSLCLSLNAKSTFHKRVDLHRVGRKILPNFWAFCLSLRIVNLQPLLQTTIHKTCSPPTLHESKYLALHFQDSLYLQIPSAWHWCKPPKILVNFLFLLKKKKKRKRCVLGFLGSIGQESWRLSVMGMSPRKWSGMAPAEVI